MRQFEFRVFDPNKKTLGHMIFMQDKQFGSGQEWDLSHRWVNTGELGISGTELLRQAEAFMIALSNRGVISFEWATASASQKDVVRWLNKNGYDFASTKNKEWFQDYIDHPENYLELYLSDGQAIDGKEIYGREPFIFSKDLVNPDILTRYLDTDYPDGKHLIMAHKDMLATSGLLRIRLQKKYQ